MFPDSYHMPSGCFEMRCLPYITLDVRSQFLRPEVDPGPWHYVVLRASMPEAAIDEDQDALFAKDEIRAISLNPTAATSVAIRT